MTSTLKAESLFRPARSKSESKHEITDSAARSIIDSEAARREAKTARLREARLAMEAQQQELAAEKPAKTKTRGAKRASAKA